MASTLAKIQQTQPIKWMIAPRVIAGGIFIAMGAVPKLADPATQDMVKQMLEKGNMPAPGVMLYLVALGELAAGLLILSGFLARIGGGLGVLLMLGALYTHVAVDFSELLNPEGEPYPAPPHLMPVITILFSGIVAVLGAGAWSVDRKLTGGSKPTGGASPPPAPA